MLISSMFIFELGLVSFPSDLYNINNTEYREMYFATLSYEETQFFRTNGIYGNVLCELSVRLLETSTYRCLLLTKQNSVIIVLLILPVFEIDIVSL